MAGKGRIRVGADADITIFDMATVVDRATYRQPSLPSDGIRHVIVGGVPVVSDGKLVPGVSPGRRCARLSNADDHVVYVAQAFKVRSAGLQACRVGKWRRPSGLEASRNETSLATLGLLAVAAATVHGQAGRFPSSDARRAAAHAAAQPHASQRANQRVRPDVGGLAPPYRRAAAGLRRDAVDSGSARSARAARGRPHDSRHDAGAVDAAEERAPRAGGALDFRQDASGAGQPSGHRDGDAGAKAARRCARSGWRSGPTRRATLRIELVIPDGKGPFPVFLTNHARNRPWIYTAVRRGYIAAIYHATDPNYGNGDDSDAWIEIYPDYDWSCLARWAWAASRTVDYLATLPEVDRGEDRTGRALAQREAGAARRGVRRAHRRRHPVERKQRRARSVAVHHRAVRQREHRAARGRAVALVPSRV